MDRKQRVIWDDNGTLKDISRTVNDFRTSSGIVIPFVAAEDAIYIGTELPFNTRYLRVGSANDQASDVSISTWDGSVWVPSLDISDETKTSYSSAASLAQSGQISFSLPRNTSSWGCEQESGDVTGLSGTYIYDMYWTKWTWSADWAATTSLYYIGSLYSTDNDLQTFYPDLSNSDLKDAFETGKTDWLEQGFAAAEAIERDLKKQSIIMRREQIFDWTLLLEASVHKTAEIIYGGLGSAYAEAKNEAAKKYDGAINLKYFEVDSDGNGRVPPHEKARSMAYLRR